MKPKPMSLFLKVYLALCVFVILAARINLKLATVIMVPITIHMVLIMARAAYCAAVSEPGISKEMREHFKRVSRGDYSKEFPEE